MRFVDIAVLDESVAWLNQHRKNPRGAVKGDKPLKPSFQGGLA